MNKQYRILEEDGWFYIQEKVYQEYDALSTFTMWLFRMKKQEFMWHFVFGRCYKSLDEATEKVNELKQKLPKVESKYHYL